MKEFFTTRNLTIAGIIILAALSRLIPHFMGYHMNIAPIMALSLFGGAYFNDKKAAFVVPMAAMLLSDVFLGFHELMFAVYGAFALGVVIGRTMQNKVSTLRVFGSSLAASIMFFLVTNFAHWTLFCPISFDGFVKCYIDAIPFFRNSLASDLVWSAVFFGSFELAGRFIPQLAENKIK